MDTTGNSTKCKHKILITGASGFIGSFLVERALELGYEVWAGVRKTSSRRWLKDERIRFFDLNLASDEALRHSLEAFRSEHGAFAHVIHAAGATQCRRPEDFFRINADGTERLARMLLETRPTANPYRKQTRPFPIRHTAAVSRRRSDALPPSTAWTTSSCAQLASMARVRRITSSWRKA